MSKIKACTITRTLRLAANFSAGKFIALHAASLLAGGRMVAEIAGKVKAGA
jgi:hypothetical protein